MISSDFRAEARRKLSGKWGKAVLILLAYIFVEFLLNFAVSLFNNNIRTILNILKTAVSYPLIFGLLASLFRLYNNDTVSAFDFLHLGFSNFKKSWGITFRIVLKVAVPIIVMVLAYILMAILGVASMIMANSTTDLTASSIILIFLGGIIMLASYIWLFTKSYYYRLAYIVAINDDTLTSKEAVEKSEQLMKGNRSKLFFLELSFIGWAILSSLTLGIGYLWLIPYIQFATFVFYFFVRENSNTESPEA